MSLQCTVERPCPRHRALRVVGPVRGEQCRGLVEAELRDVIGDARRRVEAVRLTGARLSGAVLCVIMLGSRLLREEVPPLAERCTAWTVKLAGAQLTGDASNLDVGEIADLRMVVALGEQLLARNEEETKS